MRFRFDKVIIRIKISFAVINLYSLFLGFLIMQTSIYGWIDVSRQDGDQWQPTAAYLNDRFIIGWSDTRDLAIDTSTNVYCCRVSTNGHILDTNGILIASGRPEQMVPKVCSGITDWLVIWQEGC